MAEDPARIQGQETQDASGVADQVTVNQPNPQISRTGDGEVVYDEGVAGPDPRFWGEDAERPDPFEAENAQPVEGAGGVAPDTISESGVNGPDSRWWTKEVDENGIEQYVGRDEMNYLPSADAPAVTDQRAPEVVEQEQAQIRQVDEAVAVIPQEEPTEAEGGNAGA